MLLFDILVFLFFGSLGLLLTFIGLVIWKPHWFDRHHIGTESFQRMAVSATDGYKVSERVKRKKSHSDFYEGLPDSERMTTVDEITGSRIHRSETKFR